MADAVTPDFHIAGLRLSGAEDILKLLVDQLSVAIQLRQHSLVTDMAHAECEQGTIFRLHRNVLRLLVVQVLQTVFQITQKNVGSLEPGNGCRGQL